MLLVELEKYTGQLLEVERFRDYCPNGLQVAGRAEIRSVVTGVSASLELLQHAVEADADAVLVHHGYFWKNEDPRVIGAKRARLELLLREGISLLAYHLPLDAHPVLGNNAQLGRRLGFDVEGWFGDQSVGCYGALSGPVSVSDLAARVDAVLGRRPLVIGESDREIRRVAWCSGAAQGYLEEAVGLGVDAYLTGEVSEQTFHLARESGVVFIAAGHHATERYGIQALGEHLSSQLGLGHRFFDSDNPV
jgi:dinuclear metal center YbgI/SA1388 family protein